MVFDIRGRRRHAVKVVYAVLAVLMGLSLFLVVGPLNIGEIFGSSGGGNPAGQFEEGAEKLERKLKKEPENTDLMIGITRARVNAANSLYNVGPEEEREITPEAIQQLQLASASWTRYLEATNEPSSGVAQLMAPNLIVAAQYARTVPEAKANVEAAAEAEQIVAEQRPSLNSYTTQAFYEAILGHNAKAKELGAKAAKYATSKFQRENIDNEIKRYEEIGQKFHELVKESEATEANVGKEALEGSPGSVLGETGLGSSGLGE
jgi:tetratricopeptide (TPR) repeat protein